MKILYLSSEVAPLSKTGGLGDVAGALPPALAQLGAKVMVVTPRYAGIDVERYALARRLRTLQVPLGPHRIEVGIFEGRLPGGAVPVYLIEHEGAFGRKGLYGEGGADYPDNAERFALLSRAALELARTVAGWPDVVHANDWQTALAPYYVRRRALEAPPTATVLTIHNLAFLGLFPKEIVGELGLGWDNFSHEGIEFFGQVSLLKAGILTADRITTVSPRYAREIQTEELGCGLDGLLRQRAAHLRGILNGVDYQLWDPARDAHLPARYTPADPSGKASCKAELQRLLGLPVRADVPIFGSVSRLTEQKGFDLVVAAADELARLDLQVVILGTGEPALERALLAVAERHPTRFAVRIAYDNALAHEIEAGADVFVMPSRFEPCGLNQMYSLRYGTLPLVRATGGLDDTVVDCDLPTRTGTGFKFDDYTPEALVATVKRAIEAYRDTDAWQALSLQAMRQDFSWRTSARRTLDLYEEALREVRGPGPAAFAAALR